MKKKLMLFFLSSLLLFTANSQRFQVTTGAALAEDYWAVVEESALPSGASGYVTIGNVTSTGGIGQIWISSYSSTGALLSSNRVTTNRRIIARDISKAPTDAATGLPTYYVTGWSQSAAPTGSTPLNQAFICRIRLNGTVMWYREDPTTPNGLEKEGVAVVTADNGDVAVVGNVKVTENTPDFPAGSKIFLARFSSGGAMLWHNVYNATGNWKVREMALGRPTTTSCAGTPNLPNEFVITGEVQFPTATSAGRPTTFVALYSGTGLECWRNLFPASLSVTTSGDAGYDIIYNPGRNSYYVAGVAQLGAGRGVATSTPYFVEVSLFGGFVNAAAYLSPAGGPMGLYPRCIALANSTPGTVAASIVFAGPDFARGKVFMGNLVLVGGPAAFTNYDGLATANSFGQPFILDDVQPEGILSTRLNNFQGYVISTNSYPAGAFGRGDGHLIRTNGSGQTPDSCKNNPIQGTAAFTQTFQQVSSFQIQQPQWTTVQPSTFTYAVQQKFCKDTCIVNSNFTFTQSGASVNFTGLGTGNGSLSYNWTFGDGGTSNTQNPTHTYAASGTYNVCLTVTNVNGSGDTCRAVLCKNIIVNVVNCDVVANFTYAISCKYKVAYTNTSTGTGTLTYQWFFDDGTTSTTKNPSKVYSTCGRHVTKLITCNTVCCDTVEIVVNIPCCEVKSDFCLQDSGLYVKLIYNTAMNLPSTVYTVYVNGVLTTWNANTSKLLTAGLHSICLRARRVSCPGDTCCATCCKTILVKPNCSLNSDFWYQVQSNGTVVFTNKTSPTGYTSTWNFGDGSAASTATNPTKVYASAGTYTVCLTTRIISNGDTCFSTVCKQIIIEPVCKVQGRFKTLHCLTTPLKVDFINYSSGGSSYMWDFGDGTTSTDMNPSHLYASPGTYVVCMYAIANPKCVSKVCYRVVVSNVSCNQSCTNLPPINDRNFSNEIDNEIVADDIHQDNGNSQENNMQSRKTETKTEIEEEKLALFPNPASQKIQIVFSALKTNNAEITVLNALGNIVYKKNVAVFTGKNQFSIPLQSFADGNYFVKLNAGNGVKSSMFSVKN